MESKELKAIGKHFADNTGIGVYTSVMYSDVVIEPINQRFSHTDLVSLSNYINNYLRFNKYVPKLQIINNGRNTFIGFRVPKDYFNTLLKKC